MMILKASGNGSGSRPPILKIALLVLAVAIVGFLLYRQIQRWNAPTQDVWVAGDSFASGRLIGSQDVVPRKVRARTVPAGAIIDRAAIQGKQLVKSKEAGQFFFANDLTVPSNGKKTALTRLIPEGRVLVTLFLNKRSIPYTELRQGDRMAVFAIGDDRGGGIDGSEVIAQDAIFVGSISYRQPKQQNSQRGPLGIDVSPPTRTRTEKTVALMLALRPEDVFPVVEAQASNANISAALHGKEELLDISPARPDRVELITGPNRQTIAIGS